MRPRSHQVPTLPPRPREALTFSWRRRRRRRSSRIQQPDSDWASRHSDTQPSATNCTVRLQHKPSCCRCSLGFSGSAAWMAPLLAGIHLDSVVNNSCLPFFCVKPRLLSLTGKLGELVQAKLALKKLFRCSCSAGNSLCVCLFCLKVSEILYEYLVFFLATCFSTYVPLFCTPNLGLKRLNQGTW